MNTDPLHDAFEAMASACGTVSLVAIRGGEVVFDRAVGDTVDSRRFESRTPVFLYSAVKPMTALTVLVAVADGALQLDMPVAGAWPAFGAHGKGDVTVAQALAHGAAVPGWRGTLSVADLADRETMADRLAASAPWWTPGEPGEHALSYGHLLDGILRHATGEDITSWWPVALEACDAQIDLVAGTGNRKPAPLHDPDGAWRAAWRAADGTMAELVNNPAELLDVAVVNSERVRDLVAPAVTGYGSAFDLASFWSWWPSSSATDRLGAALHRRMLQPLLRGTDHVLGRPVAWGLGPQFDNDGSFGMGGVGGCVGWYEPALDLALGIATPVVGPMERLDPIDDAISELRAG